MRNGAPDTGSDRDGDSVPDDLDNCPSIPNLDQVDSDFNGIGNACETLSLQHSTAAFLQALNNGNTVAETRPLPVSQEPGLQEQLVRIVNFRVEAGLTNSASELTGNLVDSLVELGEVQSGDEADLINGVVEQVKPLVGHVTWQTRPAQPNALNQLPITLTLKLGTNENNFPSQSTDASGFFTRSVGSLPDGTYNWRVKDPKFLANSGTVVLTGTSTINLEMGTMRAGDANNDNVVSATDFNILRGSFGKHVGDPGYDDRADFSGDQTVSSADFNGLRSNFGNSGAPPTGPVEGKEAPK